MSSPDIGAVGSCAILYSGLKIYMLNSYKRPTYALSYERPAPHLPSLFQRVEKVGRREIHPLFKRIICYSPYYFTYYFVYFYTFFKSILTFIRLLLIIFNIISNYIMTINI